MKKLLIAAGFVCSLALVAFASFTPVQADDTPGLAEVSAEAAIPARGFLCNLGFGFGLTTDTHSTISSAGNDGTRNNTIHCVGSTATPPDKNTSIEGFGCNTFIGVTTDSRLSVTPSGRVTLVCSLKQ